MKKDEFPHHVVVIAEDVVLEDNIDSFNRKLEASSRKTLTELEREIRMLGFDFIHYHKPIELARNIDNHKMDLIFPAWNGENSNSRVSIIPAICESANIRYIGADASTRSICNDKELSKSIARKLGFKVAKGIRIYTKDNLKLIENLDLPVIVKPCNEGSSIGINKESVCKTYDAIRFRIELLWSKGFLHVYAEEFVIGREISICLMGNIDGPKFENSVEIKISNAPNYLRTNPYDAKIKKGLFGKRRVHLLPSGFLDDDMKRAKAAFSYFGKINLFRIDGRLDEDNKFVFIEFATQPTFGKKSEIYAALSPHFSGYSDFIHSLLKLEI